VASASGLPTIRSISVWRQWQCAIDVEHTTNHYDDDDNIIDTIGLRCGATAVKTVIQSAKTERPSIVQTVTKIYSDSGLRGFYRYGNEHRHATVCYDCDSHTMPKLYSGFTPCIIRAFPANAVAFCGFELTVRAFNK
jgi:hypothetical protein